MNDFTDRAWKYVPTPIKITKAKEHYLAFCVANHVAPSEWDDLPESTKQGFIRRVQKSHVAAIREARSASGTGKEDV